MNRKQAYHIVQETFPQTFDKARFRNFIINLLNQVDESKASAWGNQYIKNAFKNYVSRYERIGTYSTPDQDRLDVLIVHLTHESKLDRARTAIRDFVADHLKQRDEKEAALVAFVSPTETLWRFSYVKMEYAAVRKDTGNVGVETRLTPARRFSYIVGEGESCHTAQTRFLDILQNTHTDPSLAEIEKAFSVEAVTKEFFKLYTGLFEELHDALEKLTEKDATIREEFENKSISRVDFAKKLMGQIVFLYFLQKKGWLGVERGQEWGTGPRNFLGRLAKGEYSQYRNFFNDVLEPLFYDTLAHDRGHEAWEDRFNCRIPFLNGGLFEPLGNYDWEKTDIVLPDSLFTNSEPVEEGITGTGIFDVFDRYNFTVNEAEPLEKEVAIDPEMLGKVFENLIEENRRKGMGAYYTPREIVHYMCQESLIQYLDNSINIQSESIVPGKPVQENLLGPTEPKQGTLKTAAYKERVPRGDLETFVHLGEQISHYEAVETEYRVKMPKSIDQHARLIDEKLQEIRICDPAVGSGAFPIGMMMEIVRARSALTPYFNDIHERTPYHFKRHAIQNCLYGVDIDAGAIEIARLRAWLSLVVDEEDVQQIKPLPNLDYKMVVGNSLFGVERTVFTGPLFDRLEKLKPTFFDETDTSMKAELKIEIDDLIHQLTGGNQVFDFEIYFSEVYHEKNGFDVVIANPPYVRQEKIKEIKPELKKRYDCYTGVADIYVYFYERGFRLLRQNGTLTFISSNKYFRSGYGEKLRQFLGSKATVHHLIDFGDAPIFEAIAYPSVILLSRKPPYSNQTRALNWQTNLPLEDFNTVFQSRSFLIAQKELTADGWRLESPAVLRLLEKLRRAGQPLGEYVNGRFYRGILTGYNKAFVVDRETRDRLIAEHPSSADVLKPFLHGKDVKRWCVEPKDLWLIFTRRGINIDEYPAIRGHLEDFREKLEPKPNDWNDEKQGKWPGRKGGSYKWYEIQDNIAYWQEFEEPKIIYPDIAQRAEFAFDKYNLYPINTLYIMPTTKTWLVGMLNSKVLFWYYTKISSQIRGGFVRYIAQYISQIPIPACTPVESQALEGLVENVLSAKKQDSDADTAGLEQEIDRIVYKLYVLTEEEIRIVEDC
ncbi:MAG: class I SAM-dependent DNA methyltransferase [Planctomycetes bacterium]|nr:class I SAM-dependent DNA methyltransferase [Planctomycetota bacterium]